MTAVVIPKDALAFGAGALYFATFGNGLPDLTVAGSIFTGAWTGYTPLGITKKGHEKKIDINTEDVEAAEYFDPVAIVTTSRAISVAFDLMRINATNWRRMLNGGTLTTTGSGATLLSTYKLPAPGTEVNCVLGWESDDHTERWVAQQCFQMGSLSVPRQKGADVASYPVEFRMLPDSNGDPFIYYGAGPGRG